MVVTMGDRAMTATGAKTYYLGRDDQAHTCTFAIGSRRYTYHLTPLNLDSVEYLCRKVSILKGLNLAKRRHIGTSAPATHP